MSNRVGFYLWGGPGTIRMLNLKFFCPKIDEKSLMRSYDYEYLSKAVRLFGITDVWASYSWGYSDKKESSDRDFLLRKLPNFKKLGLRVHAYVQGPNLVYSEFKRDYWARDECNRLIPYHRGRKVTCINNPRFLELIDKRISSLYKTGIDGVFVDNLQMGQLGIPLNDKSINFCGCNCEYCRVLFGRDIKLQTSEYLLFRQSSLTKFIKHLKSVATNCSLEFGANCYDPNYDLSILTGVNLKECTSYLDYVLFENHTFPTRKGMLPNMYINKLTYQIKKPVFLVSYKKGIGFDEEYTKTDFDLLKEEDTHLRFHRCIKGSEFFTKGIWHNLRLNDLSNNTANIYTKKRAMHTSLLETPAIRYFIRTLYNPILTLYFENKFVRSLFSPVERMVLH